MKTPEVFTVDGATDGLPEVEIDRLPMRERGGICPRCFRYVEPFQRLLKDRLLPTHLVFGHFCPACLHYMLPMLSGEF